VVKSPNADVKAWREILTRVGPQLGAKEVETWLRPAVCCGLEGGALRLEVPNNAYRDYITDNYLRVLNAAAAEVLGAPAHIQLEAAAGQEGLFGSAVPPGREGTAPPVRPSKLNPTYTFETFVVGRSNSFCHAACRAVVHNPGVRYNPLFIYGGVGLGKTHLMHAIGHASLANGGRNLRISYISCDQFMNEMIAAVKNNRTDAFRRKFRNVEFLLVDDIQFLAGMEGTQVEFFHTFNALYEAGAQIVLSSDRAPKDIPRVEERLRTRFEWGLIADIQPPDYETRRAIIDRKADSQGTHIPDNVADLIATRITNNIRAIEGVLKRLAAAASLAQTPISRDLALDVLNEVAPDDKRISLSLDQIQEVTAKYYNLSRRDLISKSRRANLARARQIAMFLCRDKTGSSLADIGMAFGNRDHTTVLYSITKIENEVASKEEGTVKALKEIEAKLERLFS
jgi:chromosomal replication initiator protein